MNDLLKNMNLNGSVEKHPDRPGWANDPMSASLTAFVDNKPQILRLLRPFKEMVVNIPADVSDSGRLVLVGLFDIFKKQSLVKEGITTDILWGFQQSGYDPVEVAYGLVDLKRKGYILFETPDGQITDEHNSNLKDCWVRYTDKILNMVYSG